MHRRLAGLAAGLVVAFAFVGPLTAAPIDTNEETQGTTVGDCTGGVNNSLVAVHPELLWPPNHKYYGDQANEELYFLAEGDQGEGIDLVTTGTHDQYDGDGAEFNGSGNTGDEDGDGVADDVTANDDDAMIDTAESEATMPVYNESGTSAVQTDWMARSERAGTGIREGVPNRTYTLTGDAMFQDGGSCSVEITITVPHDMGKGDGNGKKDPVR